MVLRVVRVTVFLAALAACWGLTLDDSGSTLAGGLVRTAPDLFYNYYVGPGACGGAAVQMYVAPLPVPARVGHTYVPYQPLLPHEFLYRHHRTYYRRNPNGRVTRTVVIWE